MPTTMPRAFAGLVLALPAAVSGQALCPIATDTFDNGVNLGGWRVDGGTTTVEPAGGNLGGYLLNVVDATLPLVRTGPTQGANPFTGNYFSRRVAALAFDMRIESASPFCCEPGTVFLINDAGTPDPSDDWGFYRLGTPVPSGPNGPWVGVLVRLNSQSGNPSPGWQPIRFGPGAPVPNWSNLMFDVDAVALAVGDPAIAYPQQSWRIGVDNAQISADGDPACYANCDCSSGNPRLTPADFVCFLQRYRAGDRYADCDENWNGLPLTPADFVCFLNRYRAGC